MRDIQDIETELADAVTERHALGEKINSLQLELDAARLAVASHPWLGKQVVRDREQGFSHNGTRKTIQQRGVVAVYDPKVHRRLRSLSTYNIKAGDPIVIHAKGNTGWNLNNPYVNDRGQVDGWQLEEEQKA